MPNEFLSAKPEQNRPVEATANGHSGGESSPFASTLHDTWGRRESSPKPQKNDAEGRFAYTVDQNGIVTILPPKPPKTQK